MSLIRRSILLFMLAGLLFLSGGAAWPSRQVEVPAFNSHNLIRLHVIANSDTAGDQELKRQVRDAVLAALGQNLAVAGDIVAARRLVSHNLAALTAAAEAQIERQGYSYPVSTQFGIFGFPTRAYGNLALPAGEYEAVRLVIGEGKGENWWCVLFPPLCLVDVAGKLTDGVPAASWSPAVGNKGTEPIQVRWKIVEVLKSSRQRLAGL